MGTSLRIYEIGTNRAVPAEGGAAGDDWNAILSAVAGMGFDCVLAPSFVHSDDQNADEPRALASIRRLVLAADGFGLSVMVDLPVARLAGTAGWAGRAEAERTIWLSDLVQRYIDAGVAAFFCPAASKTPPSVWQSLIETARYAVPEALFCAETLGQPNDEVLALQGAGFDLILNSVRWWDGSADWFLQQHDLLRRVAAPIGFPDTGEIPGGDPASRRRTERRRCLLAAAFSSGILMPSGDFSARLVDGMPADAPLANFVGAVNRLGGAVPALRDDGPVQRLSAPGGAVQIYARWTRARDDLALILVNRDEGNGYRVDVDWMLQAVPEGIPVDLADVTPVIPPEAAPADFVPPALAIGPGEVRLLHARLAFDVEESEIPGRLTDAPPPRPIVERVEPMLDGGLWPAKRVVGDLLEVSADIFRDGHDKIAAALRLKEAGRKGWRIAPMRFVDNDRWAGRLRLETVGAAEYEVEAWTDPFASWRDETIKKRAAAQPIALDLREGRELVEKAVARAAEGPRRKLEDLLAAMDRAAGDAALAALMTSRVAALAMALAPDKSDRAVTPLLPLVVDREAARFGAWYEIFPRSQGQIEGRSATFADCTARLPEIRAMGFDVVYLTPIHPIGRVNRKGRHNSLTAGPDDPGSPYAIGSDEGGHAAIHPDLGTLDDFRAFHRAAREQGMELALDFAVQCAPDHPWLAEHPGWFLHRADGSIRHAENPPKKYEDIVNLDFDQPDWRALWHALRDVVLFWAEEGVHIFRVDNPHTKPAPFWQWLIAEVKAAHPDAIFLAEAFTRPKMMRYLAKLGFSQSYTYFTWRTTKAELTEYLTELTRGEAAEYFRPNFFANTPDILPYGLQTGGRAAFLVRLVLAATLSPCYGLYNGFELCEAAAIPGKEEYADSEKYTYKVRDWNRPGHLKDEIAKLNRLRHESPALRRHDTLAFFEASHAEVLFYGKSLPADGIRAADQIFVAVNLDPDEPAETDLVFPLDRMAPGPGGTFATQDVLTGEIRHWAGARHRLVLDPAVRPALVLRVLPTGEA